MAPANTDRMIKADRRLYPISAPAALPRSQPSDNDQTVDTMLPSDRPCEGNQSVLWLELRVPVG